MAIPPKARQWALSPLPVLPAALGTRGISACTPNQDASFSAASRMEHFSMTATKSSTLPPVFPSRPATQESDLQDQTFFVVFTTKLSLLAGDVCVGNGHFPRT